MQVEWVGVGVGKITKLDEFYSERQKSIAAYPSNIWPFKSIILTCVYAKSYASDVSYSQSIEVFREVPSAV